MDCIIVDDDLFSRKVLRDFIAQTDMLNLVGECSSAVEAIKVLQKEHIDLMFLDIKMPGMTGMELIQSLDSKPLTILSTAHTEFASDAFEHNVTDYIVKPLNYARFYKAVKKAEAIFNEEVGEVTENHFFVKSEGALAKIITKEILWIEALENYMTINTISGKHVVHITMKSLEEKLSSDYFMRVHRSYIVRLDMIDSIIEETIIIGREVVPVGRTYKKELAKRINVL